MLQNRATHHITLPLLNGCLFIHAFGPSQSAVEVKESRHLMRHLKLPLFLNCFPKKYTEKELATGIANTLKRGLDRKGGGDRK